MDGRVLLMLPLLALAGCDRGKWIGLPPLLMTCQDLDDEQMKKDLQDEGQFNLARGMLQGVCQQSGAGNFTGDLRCEKDIVQVRCKS